jgi:hypothetical protein
MYVELAQEFAPACENLLACLFLLNDQSLKNGSGFFAAYDGNYIRESFGLSFFFEIFYIILVQKVML